MPAINLKHEIFICQMIIHGDRQKAYQAAYPGVSSNSAYFAASRLLSLPHIRIRINIAVQQAQEQSRLQLQELIKERMLSHDEKRAHLARIVRGEETVIKTVTHYGKLLQYEKGPSAWDILNAITLDCKLEAEEQKMLQVPSKN